MEQSILKSTKKIVGIDESYTAFDHDILTHINAAFAIVDQLGLGVEGGTFIQDEEATWSSLGLPDNQLNLIKTYVFLKVRLLFDPPQTSFLIANMKEQIEEYEWRLNVFREEELLANDT